MLLKKFGFICIIYASTLLSANSETYNVTEFKMNNGPQDENVQCGKPNFFETEILYGSNCAEAISNTNRSGIYEILIPSFSPKPFRVFCDAETRSGNWTIILQRLDGSVNFFRNWNSYKKGFGDLDGEFFLGLDKIHALTGERSQELLVVLEDHEGQLRHEQYEKFGIGDENEQYALQILGKSSGTAGDSLVYHHGQNFSTYDRDYSNKCAKTYTGAWWYKNCHESNLAGQYGNQKYGMGIIWFSFRGHEYSLKRAVMMIRPRK